MRILFITSSHNALSQRLFSELSREGHTIHIQLATSEGAMLGSSLDWAIRHFFVHKLIPNDLSNSTPAVRNFKAIKKKKAFETVEGP